MSTVLRVELIPIRRRWEINDKFERTIRDYYRVVCSDALWDVVSILSQAQTVGPQPLPLIGASYVGPSGGTDSYTHCKRYVAQLDSEQSPDRVIVEVEFGPDTADQDEEGLDPLTDAAVCSWGNIQTQQALQEDAIGAALKNTAGQPYDPPVQVRTGKLTLTVVTNEASFNSAEASPAPTGLLFTFNADPIWGYDSGQVLLTSYTGVPERKNGVSFFKVTKVFEIDTENGFDTLALLDKGGGYLAGGVLVTVDPKTGAPFVAPRPLLNGTNGGLLADGADPAFLEFQVYHEGDWSGLNVPDDPTVP